MIGEFYLAGFKSGTGNLKFCPIRALFTRLEWVSTRIICLAIL